jgi:hypothetical protein
MTLNLQLSPDAEAKLREQAAAAGQDVQTFVLEAVEDRLAAEQQDSDSSARRSGDHRAWLEKLRAWTALHPVVSHFVDDSRESIYGNRGE